MTSEEAWQQALALEHVAVYGFGLVGGQLGPDDAEALSGLESHRRRRQECMTELVTAGAQPVAAEPAYQAPGKVETDEQARQLAAQIEQDCQPAYLALVGQLDQRVRRAGALWLRTSAVQQARWSGQVPPLPGFADDVVSSG